MMNKIRYILAFLIASLSASLMSQTYVGIGGELEADMVLRKLGGDSIYLVNSTLLVNSGRVLRVEPGTRVSFRQNVGVAVDHGSLIIEGTDDEMIRFFRYELSKDWAGIYVKNITDQDNVSLKNLTVEGASQGILLEGCSGVVVENCEFRNNFSGIGVSLSDASDNQILNCFFKCSRGVEIIAVDSDSENNIIRNSIVDGGQIGLYILSYAPSMSYGNIIDNNCFIGSATAMYFECYGSFTSKNRKNYIRHNVISSKVYSSQYLSYGLKSSMDSLVVEDNIFWSNDEALSMVSPIYMELKRNTFYRNALTAHLVSGAGKVIMKDNVFSETFNTPTRLVDLNLVFRDNNILHYNPDYYVFINNSPRAVDMSDNYWGTDNEQVVEHIIYDYFEDPSLGKVFYVPMLAGCNDNAPLSPPYDVRKQQVGNAVLVSWEPSPEPYADCYAVYYGDYQYYKFSRVIDTLNVTSVMIENASVSDDFAVVACRGSADDTLLYSSPSRSAYAFAQATPYAGEDFVFCREKGLMEFPGATLPPGSHNIEWQTDGSGVFINYSSLYPLYFPSDADYEIGELTFTLCATCNGERLCDAVKVQVSCVPEIALGGDSYSGTQRPIVLDGAEARFYDSLDWTSSGDGYFDNPTQLNAVYYPSESDIERGRVCLYLTAVSQCGVAHDTICYDFFDEYFIQGYVWENDAFSSWATVLAVNVDDAYNSYATGYYITRADYYGEFYFFNLLAGDYILYAIPNTVSDELFGAYYWKKIKWDDGAVIHVNGDVHDVDIPLLSPTDVLPVGIGEINGYFEHPGSRFDALSFFCSAWSNDQQTEVLCDGGLSNISLFLTNPSGSHVFGFAMTDENGRFRISGLPYGEYRLWADIPRYQIGTNEVLKITPEYPIIDDVVFYIDDHNKVSQMLASDPNDDKPAFELQPNPVGDSFLITGLEPDNDYVISIHNVLGVFVLRDVHLRSDAKGTALVDVHLLPEGLYLLKVSDASSSEVIRFYKK